MSMIQIEIPSDEIVTFCRKWRITEFSFFGSVLREGQFRQDSDVDVLVAFEAGAPWSLWDLIEMRDDLQCIFGRKVDLVEKGALRNPFRRREILDTHKVIYAA